MLSWVSKHNGFLQTAGRGVTAALLHLQKMSTYKDPTAWAAIANVMRKDKRRKPAPLSKHGDTAFYIARKKGTGKKVNINAAELFCLRVRRADDTKRAQPLL